MPVVRAAPGHLDPRLVALVVEQAQLDALGVLGEQLEVRAPARPRRRRAGTAVPATPRSLDQRSRHRREFERTAAEMRVRRRRSARSSRPGRGSRPAPEPKLQTSSKGPRRTTSQRKRSSNSISRGVARAAASCGAAISSPVQAGQPRIGRRVSLERSNVAGSSGSGTSAANCGEGGELAAPPLPRRLRDVGVDVVGEELKRRQLAVLLAHEQHRRRTATAACRTPPAAGRGGHAVPVGAVADLVVVLGEDDEALGRRRPRPARRSAGAETASSRRRRRAGGETPWPAGPPSRSRRSSRRAPR